jgi:iron complex outermembrane receptor protein
MRLLFSLVLVPLFAQQLEPVRTVVVVTGHAEPVPLEEADRPVQVLDAKKLRLLSNNAADLLRLDSSLDLRARGANGVQSDLSIRGGSFGQTLVLFDGLRMNDAQSGHHSLNLPLTFESLGQVEVLKGTGSTLYGSDAIGGVVQFVPRRPESTELRLWGGLGSFGTNQQRVQAGFVFGTWSQILSATRDFSTGFIPNRDYRNLTVTTITEGRTKLGTSRLTLGHNDRPFGAQQFYGNFPSWERTKAWFAGIRQDLGERTDVSFGYRRHTDLFVLFRDRPQVFTNRHASEHWQAAVRRGNPLKFGRVYYGIEGYGDQIASSNLGSHSRTRAAGYAGWDVRALKRFSLNLGIRDEVWGSFRHELSPNLAAGYWLSEQVRFRGSASRAFRVPTYTELFYQDPANRGSANLRPERAWSFEGGLDWRAGSRWDGQVTVFRRNETDVIDWVRPTVADIWRSTNFAGVQFTGLELSGRYRRLGQVFDVQYTGLSGARAATGGLLSKYVFNYPSHSGLVGWTGGYRGVALRSRVGVLKRLGRNPYAVTDVYASRVRGQVKPFLQVTNLANQYYEEIAGVRMPGRMILGGIEWQIQ